MPGLIRVVYEILEDLSNPSNNKLFNSKFHKFLQLVAYTAAQHDKDKESPETYWDAAKAHVALELTRSKNIPPSHGLNNGFFIVRNTLQLAVGIKL